jgi:uncharacterized Zn finger protein
MSRWNRYWDREYFPPSRPLDAKGGIKSQARRGAFGESWWAKRWIAVLESFQIGARLQRGRSYARRGQALSIDIEKGIVKAKVQGSRPRPYDVTIKIKTLSGAQWKKLEKTLASAPIYAARLLAGEIPQDIEEVFKQAGVSLFPQTSRDLQTDCSCPDWSNPCKHIAAVYYLLGEEFDRDPFLIFKLRGRTREEVVGGLQIPSSSGETEAVLQRHHEPLPENPAAFWQGAAIPENLYGEVRVPQIQAALAKRLGNFPFWRGNVRLMDALEPIYASASNAGLEVLLQADTLNQDERLDDESAESSN